MKLTVEDKKMLDGEYGPAVQFAMRMLTRLGEGYEAERMVAIQNAHVCFCYQHLLAMVETFEKFAELGGKCRVPTTTNPGLCNTDRWKELPESHELQDRARRGMRALESIGVTPTYTCTPYFHGNIPHYGEMTSWVESSAIIYANSVLGARTNRTTMGIDLAAAIAGRVPEFGMLLDENRIGNVHVKMTFQPETLYEYGAFGYLVGKLCSGKIPVIEGISKHVDPNQLEVFGAAAASQGGIALYHMVGITPEARTKEDAFQGRKPEYELTIGKAEIDAAINTVGELSTCDGKDLDAVLIGCPHATVEEMRVLAGLLEGKFVKRNMKFWVYVSSAVVELSRKMGYTATIEAAGAELLEGDCITRHPTKSWGWKRIATDSAKFAIILPSDPTWLDVWYADTAECVRAGTE